MTIAPQPSLATRHGAMFALVAMGSALALSGCGRRADLVFPNQSPPARAQLANPGVADQPATGQAPVAPPASPAAPGNATGPATPVGAVAPPRSAELLDPSTQARPKRNDELLRQSEERQSDEFDLPPA